LIWLLLIKNNPYNLILKLLFILKFIIIKKSINLKVSVLIYKQRSDKLTKVIQKMNKNIKNGIKNKI
jgi:hypothetical protein